MPLDYKEFASKIKAKYPEYKDVDDLTLAQKMVEKYPEYKGQVNLDPVKKKEPTVSNSPSGQKPTSSGTQDKKSSGQSVSSYEVKSESKLADGSTQKVIYGDAGKGSRAYALRVSPDGRQSWYEYSHSGNPQKGDTKDYFDKPITDPNRVSTLNSKFGYKASTVADRDIYTGYPGKEQNEYRVSQLQNGQEVWEVRRKGQDVFTTISDPGSISSLNREFDKSVESTDDAKQKREAQLNRQASSDQFKLITGDVMSNEEEILVEALRNTYKDKGFTFNEVGKGDAIDVLVNDGSGRRATFYLDNSSDETNKSEALKLRTFLQENQILGDYVDLEKEEERKAKSEYKGLTQVDFQKQMQRLQGAGSQAEFEMAKSQNLDEFIGAGMAEKSQEAKELRKDIIRGEYNSKQKIADITRVAKTEKDKEEIAAIAKANQDEFVKRYWINDNYVNDLAETSKVVDQKFKVLSDDVNAFNESINDLSEEEISVKKAELESRYNSLLEEGKDIRSEIGKVGSIEEQNQKDAALYLAYNETRGSVSGGLLNSAIKGVFGLLGSENAETLAKSLGSEMTTDEFMQSDDRLDITKAAFSVTESLGAMATSLLTGGAATAGNVGKLGVSAAKTLPFFAMSYNEIKSEMNTDEFNDVPAWQKEGLAIIYGLGVGYLDKVSTTFGVKGVPANIARNTIFRAISGLEKGATTQAIESAITAQFKKDISAGLIKIAGGALVEGATEGTQSLYGSGLKKAFNYIQGEDKFNVDNWASDAATEAYMGALGGLIMSVPSGTVRGIKNGFNRMSPEYVELSKKVIEDSNLRSMVTTDIKTKLMSGKITKEEAKEQLDAIKEASGLFDKLPANLSPENSAKSIDLIIERSKIEKEISGKEDNLVVAQKERIKEINTELQSISTESVQPVATEEVTADTATDAATDAVTEETVVTEGIIEADPKTYSDALIEAKAEMGKEVPGLDLQVSDVTEQEAKDIIDEGGKVFMTSDGKAGAYVKKDGYMGGLFKSPKSEMKEVAKVLQDARIKAGGYFMDAYGTKLEDIYIKNGFRPVARLKFNEEYAPEGWNADGSPLKDKPDVVFFAYDPKGEYSKGDGEYVDEYDTAYEMAKSYKNVAKEVEAIGQLLSGTDQEIDQKASKVVNKKISKSVATAAKSISKVSPDTKFVVHDTDESYRSATKEEGKSQSSNGEFNPVTNTIHINGTKANSKTVAHEVFHAILINKVKTDENAAAVTKRMVQAISSKIDNNPSLKKKLDDFVSNYDENIQNEEKLAELVGILAENYNSFSAQIKDIITRWINKLASIFKQNSFDKNETYDILNVIARKIAKGDEISEADISVMSIDEQVESIKEDMDGRKQKVTSISDIVRITKDKGFSDAAIRQYLKDQGFSDKQATAAINEYNVKKEGIFVRKDGGIPTKIADSIRSFRRRMLSARSFLPKSVFTSREDKDASVARHLNIVDQNVKDFNRLYAKYKGDKDALVSEFDKYIRGDKDAKCPDDFMAVANSMRNQIDGLSMQLISSGLVDADMAQTIKDNLGQYLTRSYKIYDRDNWKKEVEDEVKQKAINLLKSQYREMAQEISNKEGIPLEEVLDNLVTNRLDEILTTEGAKNFITGSKLGSKDLSVLKERQDIPVEIRMLLGEYSDPALNYAKTVLKLSSLAANHKFLTDIKEAGMGVYFFKKDDPRRPADFNTMIASKGSESMDPLNELYTTKEIAEAFMAQPSQLSDFWKTFMKFQSTVRWLKTIGSAATHLKNVFGNTGFIWINAHLNPKEIGKAFMTVRNDFSKKTNQQRRDKMNNYIALGIVKQSAGLGEIMDMFKDADWDTAMASRLSNQKLGILGKTKRFFLQGKKWMEDMYQAEDDFFKVIAYEHELSRYSEAMFDKNKSELTEEELTEVNKVVTEIIKNTYPTYDRIPEAVKMVRRAPFIGNFVSFQAESYRTAFNTMALAKNELASDNKKIKAIGAQRSVGATTYLSAKSAILAYLSMAAGTGLTGLAGYLFDDEDEEQKDKDIRKFVAPWSEKSDLIILSIGNGEMKYIDFSSSDPHGGMKKVMNAFFLGETTIEGFSAGIVETFAPFIGEDMTVEALLALKNNQDKYGNPIYNTEESLKDQGEKVLSYMYKLVEPGTFSSIRRVIEAEDKSNELVANIFGLRTYDVDINKQFGYKMKDYSERISNAKKIYNQAYFNEKATEADKEKAYKKAQESLNGIYTEITEVYNSAERLGCDPKDLGTVMADFGNMSKRTVRDIQSGSIPELKKKD